jgi:hypothetical protein
MKVGGDNKQQRIIAGVLGFFALLALYPLYQDFFGGPSAPPPAALVIRDASGAVSPASTTAPVANVAAAKKVGPSSQSLDPTLHMEAMLRTESLVYSGTGRNIFSAAPYVPPPPATKMPTPIAYGRPTMTPPPMIAQGPPPNPPINLKFFGTATSANGERRAFLVNGDNVFIASAGDVVERRYRIISISANSISVEDMPNSNKQTLPLLAN